MSTITPIQSNFSVLQQIEQSIASTYEYARIILTDILPAQFECIIPNALSWAYRSWWTGSITSYTFTADKVAHLFVHGEVIPSADGQVHAVLLLHGDHSHPLTMLHLADLAQQEGKTVFSVHLPYDDECPENHRALLRNCFTKMQQLADEKGACLDVKTIGHSRGALEGASMAYECEESTISGVIAIAGRFKVISPSDRPCRESLQPSVQAVWQRLCRPQLPVPFYQIAAAEDWCMDPEASIVRPDQPYATVDASHLGVIYHPNTLEQVRSWITA